MILCSNPSTLGLLSMFGAQILVVAGHSLAATQVVFSNAGEENDG
jgi:hypothetical protein